ncbi:scavenger receptor cysteine-rich type 1 protein M130-like [Ruditapes philippinarum]|uniref:scavenger receptor cysteine-rich type 1 protein M130-like n=1 Tax=Ruditapes philippinarum TaxID=129788 RepID=UPI00295AD730|nr:scavenger receptor cysteine-rich type 1 protein M130-like [Ruditapes philippinarum]
MSVVKAGILFLCILFVHCDRLRQLERKMFTMQTMVFQDIGMLRESADRNFEELQRLSMIINASLSQKSLLPTPVQTSAPDSKEEESESKVTHLESQVRRIKRGFKDQKLFFHSWKENLSNEVKDLQTIIEKHSNEIADKVKNETSNAVNAMMSFTKEVIGSKIKGIQDSLEFVMKFQDTLDSISQNVTTIKDSEVINTRKLNALSTVHRNFSEEFISSIEVIKNEQKISTFSKDVLNICSAAVQNSEHIINVLFSSVNNQIRLVDGPTASSGRLEVLVKGAWGTVCDDSFGVDDANVACKALGFKRGIHRHEAYYGRGSGPILFDEVQCKGNERNLLYCKIDFDTSDCNHGEDAGVDCYN